MRHFLTQNEILQQADANNSINIFIWLLVFVNFYTTDFKCYYEIWFFKCFPIIVLSFISHVRNFISAFKWLMSYEFVLENTYSWKKLTFVLSNQIIFISKINISLDTATGWGIEKKLTYVHIVKYYVCILTSTLVQTKLMIVMTQRTILQSIYREF